MVFKKLKLLITFSSLFLVTSFASASNTTEKTAQFLCDYVFGLKSYSYEKHFTKTFIEAVSESQFRRLVDNTTEAIGKCNHYRIVKTIDQRASYFFISHSDRYLEASFSINDQNLIESFSITDVFLPDIIVNSWGDVISALNSFDGNTAITITNFDGLSYELRSNEMQPIASGFKLYILGALSDSINQGRFRWQDQFPITNKWKSLPSGIMQTWAQGNLVSLYDYAEHMIKISDNTATDHLLHIIGREKVEEHLHIFKNNFISKNRPLLSTAEMFKLKWAAPVYLINDYIQATEAERRAILGNDIAQISFDKIGTNGVSIPSYVREIEWFGSTNNLCTAMQGLRDTKSSTVKKILSQNTPFINVRSSSHWKYGGYKGGSEPGVLTMTYLLQSHSGQWGCVSMAWHNENKELNDWIFFDFARKLLELSEQLIN